MFMIIKEKTNRDIIRQNDNQEAMYNTSSKFSPLLI